MSSDKYERQPSLFIPHGGGPCFFMDWDPADTWEGMANFLKGIESTLPQRPEAIVLISAHWLAPQFTVTGHARPPLIYDYYGFPAHTYELSYPASGQPELAKRVVELITASGMTAQVDAERGFDHGMFIPLKVMFPQADIPVVQLSLRQDLDPQAHLQVGQALAELRDDNVLIIGSGMSFHNMRAYGDSHFTPVSDAFDDWLTNAVQTAAADRERHLQHWTEAPHARLCHPPRGEEHLMPLMVAAGAGGDEPGHKIYSERVWRPLFQDFNFLETSYFSAV